MAISISEERRDSNMGPLLMWAVVIFAIILGVYFLFFKNPGSSDVDLGTMSTNEGIVSISNIDPDTLISGALSRRVQFVSPVLPGTTGRENPFLPL